MPGLAGIARAVATIEAVKQINRIMRFIVKKMLFQSRKIGIFC